MTREEMKRRLRSREGVIDGHTHVGVAPRFYYQFGYPYALSLEDLVIRMQALNIDYSVVFPFVDSAFYEVETTTGTVKTTTRFCNFPYEIENRNLLNEIHGIFPDFSERVLPFLMFDPSRETEKQAAHLEKLARDTPVFGLKTATTYIQAFVKDLETKGKPILDLAREKQLPIVFHSSVHPADPWAPVQDILTFAKKHPELRVCVAHSARFSRAAFEAAAQMPNCFVDLSAFSIHCQLAVQNSPAVAEEKQRFPADYSHPRSVMLRLAEAYPDTLLWGTDTPFYYWIQKYTTADGKLVEDRLPCGWQEEAQLLHSLPKEIKKKIAYENTLKFIFG